ncbi:ComEA family DNA-binding protein [Micromonospora sp. NPDC049060]|uniref:ComEA family DNA-binding protein n=1 Tax=unclassified Micromonospora TaxID=2617518 RepID=UPI0033C122D6
MSEDEETVVRERLRQLVAGWPSSAAPAHPGGSADPLERTGEPVGPFDDRQGPAGLSGDHRRLAGLSVDRPGSVGVPEPVVALPPRTPASPPRTTALPSRTAALPVGAAAAPEPDPPARAPEAGVASRLPGPGAFDPGRRGVRALAAVAVLVVLGAGFWAWRSRPQTEPVRPVATAEAPDATVTGLAEPAATSAGELVVAVAGKVRRPGLVRVPAGARVADAVEAAGGALPGVDVALLNPARKVTDGELILVGVAAPPGAPPPPGAAPGGAPGAPGAGGRLNLNTATLAQLDALPGVGPVLAQRILTHRDQQGGFRSVGDLRQVDGIGDARYEQLKDLVTV